MRKVVKVAVYIAVFLLVHRVLYGQEKVPSFEEQILAQAAKQARVCPAYADKTIEDDKGKVEVAQIERNEIEFAKKLKIPLLFKQGRFRLEHRPDSRSEDGRKEIVIAFSPLTDGKQLKPEAGENETLNNVLNHLSGTVRLDDETRNITEITGELTETILIQTKWHVVPVNLSVLKFTYKQASRPGGWIPTTLNANARVWVAIVPHSRVYKLRFDCGM